jgi:PKD repeat protein
LRANKTMAVGLLLLMAVLTLSHSFTTQLANGNSPSEVAILPTTSTFNYVVVIAMQNASINNIIGNPLAPYLNYLASTYGLATSYTVVSPHKVPDYLAMTGASTFGLTTDCTPSTCPISSPNIVDQIEGAGLTWRAWAEDYNVTQGCSSVSKNAGYNVKSFPFLYYTDITGNASRCNDLLRANTVIVSPGPETDNLFLNSLSSASTAANYNWLAPNSCDSMHSCLPLSTIATADTYLSNLVPAILNSYIFTTQKAALLLTFAEGVQTVVSTTDYVPTIWAGPVAKTNYQSSNQYDHYSMLKTIEGSWGLASLTSNDGNAVDMNEFLNAQLSVTSSATPSPTEVGTQVNFSAVASGGTAPYTSYSWDFGDGATAATDSSSTTRVYTSTGTFTTTVTVTDSVGSKSTSPSTTIIVDKTLSVTASASPNPVDAGTSESFAATSIGGVSPISCNWSFGDGSSRNGCTTTHTFSTSGTFTAIVTATDSLSAVATSSVAVTVDSKLTVSGNANPNPTEVGTSVSFTATATGGTTPYTSYVWTFGDGTTASTTTASTTHTYTSTGIFTAIVKVTDSSSSSATSSSVSITVNPKLSASAIASSNQTDVGVSESFTAAISGGVGSPSCSWSFGDGSTDTVCSTSHSYTTVGTFAANLTLKDSLGVTVASSVTVTVNAVPVVDFSFTPSSPTNGQSVTFTATTTYGTGPFTFSWSFGDGNSGSGNPVSHTYATPGTLTVSLNVTDALGDLATKSYSVVVMLGFGVSITSVNPSPSEVGVQVVLTATVVGGTPPYTCSWSFGDGSSAAGCSASHTYTSAGNFTITINAGDSTGQTMTDSRSLVVNARLVTKAGASPNPTDMTFSVNFTAAMLGGVSPVSCSWTFGDGSSGTGCTTTHTYASLGSFTANVTATDSLGITAIGTVTITVNSQLSLNTPADSPNPTEVGTVVTFTVTATGGTAPYTSYSWNFGDGTTATTSTASTTHTYTSAGTFTTTVTATDSARSKISSSVSLIVDQKLAVTAKAVPNPTEVGRSQSFAETSSGGVGTITCSWSFGDSTAGAGCSTSHAYTTAGTFIAVVTATDGLVVVATGNVTVTVNPKLTVTAGASPNPIDAGILMSFTATISGGVSPVSCNWAFGDGSSATGCSTTHTYAIAGTFFASITATDSLSITATSSLSVAIHPKLTVAASASSNLTEVGRLISLAGTASGGVTPITCIWSFGDGSSSTGCASIHTYTTVGLFIANLTATDSLGVTATSNVTVTVNPKLAVTIGSASPNPTEVSKSINFTSTSSGGVGSAICSWDFGDGGLAGTCSASHFYSTSGNFTVIVTATDSLGVSASGSITVSVKPKLAVTATVTPKTAEVNVPVTFNATTSRGVGSSTCSWSFGDGSSDSGCLTSHTYGTSGIFTANVTVVDGLGVTVSHTVSVRVNPSLIVTANASSILTVGTPVSFTVSITGGVSPVSCSWTFGDGSSSTGCLASHSYTAAGAFVATAIGIDSLNVTSTYSMPLFVDLALTLSIQPSPAEVGVPVTFVATATGGLSPYMYSWSFGDGASQTGSIVAHAFTSPGLYSVKLTVTDNNGNVGFGVRLIQVEPALTVTVSSDSAEGVAPVVIRFNATASWGVGPYTFRWNFGDGQKATGPSAVHNYTIPDSYTVQVTVTDSEGIIASGRLTVTVTAPSSTPATSPTNVATTGPIPVDLLTYSIGGLLGILVIIAPIYVIMVRRRQSSS